MLVLSQVLFSGLATGCVYGLVALSFVLIYKATGVISFMQGELLMLGAFVALALDVAAGWPWLAAVLAAPLLLALLGALLERGVLRHALGRSHLTAVLLTFGLALIIRGVVGAIPAANQITHRLALPFAGQPLTLGPLVVAGDQLVVLAATALVVVLLHAFFHRTRLGLALRACAEDAPVAALLGVPVARLHTVAWALGAALAACAGILAAPFTFVHPAMGLIALKAFPAAVLGGLGSLPGALCAGLLLGVVEALAGLALPEGAKEVVPYLLLLVALLLFPSGLGGLRGQTGGQR